MPLRIVGVHLLAGVFVYISVFYNFTMDLDWLRRGRWRVRAVSQLIERTAGKSTLPEGKLAFYTLPTKLICKPSHKAASSALHFVLANLGYTICEFVSVSVSWMCYSELSYNCSTSPLFFVLLVRARHRQQKAFVIIKITFNYIYFRPKQNNKRSRSQLPFQHSWESNSTRFGSVCYCCYLAKRAGNSLAIFMTRCFVYAFFFPLCRPFLYTFSHFYRRISRAMA